MNKNGECPLPNCSLKQYCRSQKIKWFDLPIIIQKMLYLHWPNWSPAELSFFSSILGEDQKKSLLAFCCILP